MVSAVTGVALRKQTAQSAGRADQPPMRGHSRPAVSNLAASRGHTENTLALPTAHELQGKATKTQKRLENSRRVALPALGGRRLPVYSPAGQREHPAPAAESGGGRGGSGCRPGGATRAPGRLRPDRWDLGDDGAWGQLSHGTAPRPVPSLYPQGRNSQWVGHRGSCAQSHQDSLPHLAGQVGTGHGGGTPDRTVRLMLRAQWGQWVMRAPDAWKDRPGGQGFSSGHRFRFCGSWN